MTLWNVQFFVIDLKFPHYFMQGQGMHEQPSSDMKEVVNTELSKQVSVSSTPLRDMEGFPEVPVYCIESLIFTLKKKRKKSIRYGFINMNHF